MNIDKLEMECIYAVSTSILEQNVVSPLMTAVSALL